MIWRCGKFEFDTITPTIMGVINVTPDSFSDGGSYATPEEAVEAAKKMASEGAAIIDVGGESTRPGAAPVDVDEEWRRIQPVVSALCESGICVSVDTMHAEVAKRAIEAGASVINDVSGFRDHAMVDAVRDSNVGLVVMHMKGTPETMQDNAFYDDVVQEVSDYLRNRAQELIDSGIDAKRICVDPGPGFGKTPQQTIELMRNIHELRHLGFPVMVAVSRKRFIAHAYHIEDPDPKARDEASAQEALMACELGASIIRTHNVRKTVEALSGLRPYALLGLGSNIALVAQEGEEAEGKVAQLNLAVGMLCQLPDTQLIDMAPFYESEPAYDDDQENFVNTVVLLRTGLPPKELLEYLHTIENTLGRVRNPNRHNGPRTIDLDILDYQLYTALTPELTLPHPRINERDFVIKPLCDILPNHILADGSRVGDLPEDKRYGRAWRLGK